METYNRPVHGVEEYQEVPDKTTGRDFSIGLAVGLIAGTIGGLLIAPKSGDALRDDIQNQTDKLTKKNLPEEDSEIKQLKKEADAATNQLREKMNEDKNVNSKKNEYNNTESIKSDDAESDEDFAADAASEDSRTVDMNEYVPASDNGKSK